MSGAMLLAAGKGGGGLPLWLVCALTFTGLLAVGLALVLGPLGASQRKARDARVGELRRYRVHAAQSQAELPAPAAHTTTVMPRGVTTRALRIVDRAVRWRGQRDRIVVRMERSGVRMRPEEWATIQLAAVAACGAVAAVLLGSAFAALLGGVIGWLLCLGYVRFRTNRRMRMFEEQLPDALQLVAGALRSGFALNQSIGAVAREGAEPVAEEFGRVLQEVRLGAELEDALEALAERVRSYDLTLVVMAIRTAREIGGNLAEVLQTTVTTMRERVQLRGQVRVLSAEGRFSAKVLTGLPLLMAGYLLAFKRAYIAPLYSTSLGVVLVVVGATLLICGSWWLHRLTKIEV